MQPRAGKESPFERAEKEVRRKPRLLPLPKDRRSVTVYMSLAMRLKFGLLALLEDKTEYELMTEAVHQFLDAKPELGSSYSHPSSECRFTLVMTEGVKGRMDEFASARQWTKSDTVAIALILYLEKKGINPYTDPKAKMWEALKS